jgi:hypothetical protein
MAWDGSSFNQSGTKPEGVVLPFPVTRASEAGICRSEVSRHDLHNLEIKTTLEPGKDHPGFTAELYLFFPRSFRITYWTKAEIAADYDFRVRLAAPVRDTGRNALDQLLAKFESLAGKLEEEAALIEVVQSLGCLMSEALKSRGTVDAKEIFYAHSLLLPEVQREKSLHAVLDSMKSAAEEIANIRQCLARSDFGLASFVRALEEYLHYLYIQYLWKIDTELAGIQATHASNADAGMFQKCRNEIEHALAQLRLNELQYNGMRGLPGDRAGDDRQMARLSQLKKFFQSSTFLETRRSVPFKKLAEPAAIVGTAIAGFWAVLFDLIHKPGLSHLGFRGSAVISLGVLTFVFKDRLKDQMKALVSRKLSQYLPDSQCTLMLDGKLMGLVKEWRSFYSYAKLPAAIRTLRQRAFEHEVEQWIPEDLWCHRDEIEFEPQARHARGGLTMQKVLRINFERFLKYLDDPIKDIPTLKSDGSIRLEKGRRLYEVYLAVSHRPLGSPTLLSSELFRILFDKSGIHRIEPVL